MKGVATLEPSRKRAPCILEMFIPTSWRANARSRYTVACGQRHNGLPFGKSPFSGAPHVDVVKINPAVLPLALLLACSSLPLGLLSRDAGTSTSAPLGGG